MGAYAERLGPYEGRLGPYAETHRSVYRLAAQVKNSQGTPQFNFGSHWEKSKNKKI